MNFSKSVICALLVSTLTTPLFAAPGHTWKKPSEMRGVESKINAKEYQSAINELKILVARNSDNADAFNLLGYSNRKLKNYDVAEKYYLEALKIDPTHKGAMEYLGELYVETGRMDKANQMLSRLDEACFISCSEYKTLKEYIETKEMGLTANTSW